MPIPVESFFLAPEAEGTLQAQIRQIIAEGILSGRLRKGEEIAVADAARHIQDAIDAGEIPAADPTVLAHAMLGVHTRLVHLVATGQVERDDEIIDTAVDFCVNGISGPHPRC